MFTPVNLQIYHYGGNNPIRYTDPTGENNEVADMHVWEATFAELTVSSYMALGEGGGGVSTCGVYVHFLNRETGESFEAMYTFTLDSIGDSEVLKPLGAAAVSVGGGIDFGMVTGSFPSDFSPEDIAESFSGNFINTSLSLPLVGPLGVTGTGITSESWSGFSFAASLGWGGGFAEMITHYSEPFNMTPLRGPLSPSQERARQRW